jgi:GT2 family glycosyltransferase
VKREKVKVIIVTYNSFDCIFACLKSLDRASENFDLHITFVDNASTDTTLAAIITLQSKANIEVISNLENLGYAYGNNLAIEAMFSEELQYAAVLILNPDVTLPFMTIDNLLLVLQLSEEVGAVSPNLIEPGQSPNWQVRIKSLWGWSMKKRFMKHENIIEVDRLHGGCMLIKPDLFKKIGTFDESYFLYWEEIDLCQRARKAGYKLLQCYDIFANHAGDSKIGRYRSHRIYYMWRNQFYFAFKTSWFEL